MDYKEKLEEAKELYKTANADQKYVLELLFPELKRNEEERIRKALIDYFNHHKNGINIFYDIKGDDVIAWLEKQGEQKPYGQRKECLDCQFNYAGECKGSCAMKRSEQKPAEWSEEDEKNLIEVISIIQNINSYDKQYDGYINWLKSLKYRIQPKQDWSEDDEEILNGIILRCKKYGYQEQIDWLKSLKSCLHWKPTNEQKEALRAAYTVGNMQNIQWAIMPLKTLYKQLNTL